MLQAAFTLLGTAVTWLEVVAFGFALACVLCTVYEIHWGWPLLVASSLLYGWLFFVNRLYGDVAVQAYFALSSLWGWWEWVFGRRPVETDNGPGAAPAASGLAIARLSGRGRLRVVALWLLAWPLAGALLARFTDTDVAYFNGFSTAGSFIAQALMGLKYIECWPLWMAVDLASVALYATKSLWLTSVLSLIFTALALVGWRRWAGPRPPAPVTA